MTIFEQYGYKHEALTMELVDEVLALGNPSATKLALYALTLEGALHQIADHDAPNPGELAATTIRPAT